MKYIHRIILLSSMLIFLSLFFVFYLIVFDTSNKKGNSFNRKLPFQELESDIEAVECTCGVPVDVGKCSQPIPQGVGCVLYDSKVKQYIKTGFITNFMFLSLSDNSFLLVM